MAPITMADLPPPDPDTARKILALIGPNGEHDTADRRGAA